MALVRFILGKFLRVACHCFPRLLEVHTFHHQVPPRPPRRETSYRGEWELLARMISGIFVEIYYMPQIHEMGPTPLLPSEERRAEDFFALKIRTASARYP